MPTESQQPKQKGRFLIIPPNELRVTIPFGFGLKRKECVVEITSNDRVHKVTAALKSDRTKIAQLHPAYSATERLNVKGKLAKLRVWVVLSDLDRLRGRQLIEREHYLMPTGRGLFLACGIEEDSAKTPRIIGVAVLDTLVHGNPYIGRSHFATEVIGSRAWMKWPRDKIVDKLGLSWASRFAVHSSFHGFGIGTLLARHLKTVARNFRLPPADFIEVITTVRKTKEPSQRDFLVEAGYTRVDTPLKSSPLRELNEKTGYIESFSAKKHYYFVDVRRQ